MTIIHDPERRRSTHLETGLAVQWVRDEPPMERQTHFKLIADGIETPFVATYDYGEPKLKARYPNMSALEFNERMGSVQEKNFHAINLKRDFDRDVFLRVWQDLVAQGLSGIRVSTYYTEVGGPAPRNQRTWSCER